MSWFLLDQNQLVERCNQGFPHDISTVVFDIPNNKIIQFKSDIGKTKYKLAYLEMIPADTSKKLKEYIENSK